MSKCSALLPESSDRIEFSMLALKGIIRIIDCGLLGGTGGASVH